jgi:hypothetical protein
VVLQIPSESVQPRQLLFYKRLAPVTLLNATLAKLPVSVANKRLAGWLTPLSATLTKEQGGGGGYG